MKKKKLIRVSTVPGSLNTFCRGLLAELNEHYDVVAVSSTGPALDEIASREGVRTIAVPMERHISIFKDMVSLVRMIIVMLRERPDIVHSITPKGGLITMLAAWITRVPVRIHTFTGLVWPISTGVKRRILMFTDRVMCHCATYINPEGEGVKRDLESHGITRKPLHIIAHGNIRGIDLEHYQRTPQVVEQAQEIRQEAFTFVFVGRLTRDKGINELIAAFARLHDEDPQVRLLLVGKYEQQLDPLKPATVEAIKTHPAIYHAGRQDDIRPWLAASDALVFPSYREGFPNVVIEAGALQLPSIVTDINGSNEIVVPGETGVIIPAQDEEALFQAMREFVHTPSEQLQAMGQTARHIVTHKWDYHIIWQGLLDTYKQLQPPTDLGD